MRCLSLGEQLYCLAVEMKVAVMTCYVSFKIDGREEDRVCCSVIML